MKAVVLTTAAARQLDALPKPAAMEIEEALAMYAVAGRGDVRRLRGREGFRLRIGRYRVIFGDDSMIALAIYIGERETTTFR